MSPRRDERDERDERDAPRAPEPRAPEPREPREAREAPLDPDEPTRPFGPAALLVIVALALGGWLVIERLSAAKKAQDCLGAGRRNCGSIEAPPR